MHAHEMLQEIEIQRKLFLQAGKVNIFEAKREGPPSSADGLEQGPRPLAGQGAGMSLAMKLHAVAREFEEARARPPQPAARPAAMRTGVHAC